MRRHKTGTAESQPILFQPPVEWEVPSLNDLPRWSRFHRIGLDIETCDPDLKRLGPAVRRNGFIAGVSFALDDPEKTAVYLPIAHALGDNLEREKVIAYLRDQAAEFTGEIVGANLQYDLDYLAQYGVVFRRAVTRDVQVAEALISELHDRYSLEAISQRRGFGGKAEEELQVTLNDYRLDGKRDLWKLPAKYVAKYAEVDAQLPLKILEQQQQEISEQGLQKVFDLESRLLPVLVKMRRRGVLLDFDKLAQIELKMLAIEQTQAAHISEMTGTRFAIEDITKAAIVGRLLEATGIRLPRTPKSNQLNVDKEVLAAIDTPLSHAFAKAKRANKIRTTFVASIRRHAVEGRIHCTFTQLRKQREDGDVVGAAFGRISSSQPNLQQQPIRDELADDWRSIYLPDPGGEWACLDYSQQEPRILLHWASQTAENVLPQQHPVRTVVSKAVATYRNDPSTDGHQMMADLIGWTGKEGRTRAKTIFLGLCYGMGGRKLANGLGLPTTVMVKKDGRRVEVAGHETLEILNEFNARLPYVHWMSRLTETRVKERGHLTTLSGRRCRFPVDELGNVDWAYKALNRLIQGSAADQTKMAMVAADDAGFKLQLQVHDEFDLTVQSRQEAHALAELMRDVVTLNVPSLVDVEAGRSWGEIESTGGGK